MVWSFFLFATGICGLFFLSLPQAFVYGLFLSRLTLCPRDTQGYSRISLSLSRQDFERVLEHRVSFEAKPHVVFHGVCEIALTEVLTTQMGVMRRSKKAHLNCINLIHFHLTAGRLHGSLCIVIPEVVCELLQFVATQ